MRSSCVLTIHEKDLYNFPKRSLDDPPEATAAEGPKGAEQEQEPSAVERAGGATTGDEEAKAEPTEPKDQGDGPKQ